jgi:hypothetical protein
MGMVIGPLWVAVGPEGARMALGFFAMVPIAVVSVWGIFKVAPVFGRIVSWYFRLVERITGLPIGKWGRLFEEPNERRKKVELEK